MRVAPLGAYFADDPHAFVEHAQRSAEVTHAHPEAVAGAIAVASAAALACQLRDEGIAVAAPAFLDRVLSYIPDSDVRDGVRQAHDLPSEITVARVAEILGSGERISAQDTVPFTLWCAARYLDNFEEAIWATVSGFGDRDTTCAIVGGIVASFTGAEGIPVEWRTAREPLPDWTD